jgi:hypothetical protein
MVCVEYKFYVLNRSEVVSCVGDNPDVFLM